MKANINYSITDIKNLKNNFKNNNSEIIEKLKILEREYTNMNDILSTPNSNKIIPELCRLIKQFDEYTTSSGLYFDGIFNTVIDEYSSFVAELSNSVRGVKQ